MRCKQRKTPHPIDNSEQSASFTHLLGFAKRHAHHAATSRADSASNPEREYGTLVAWCNSRRRAVYSQSPRFECGQRRKRLKTSCFGDRKKFRSVGRRAVRAEKMSSKTERSASITSPGAETVKVRICTPRHRCTPLSLKTPRIWRPLAGERGAMHARRDRNGAPLPRVHLDHFRANASN
jgi:hypothetical protein